MLIHDFPTDIYQELLSWLGYDDQVAFAMVNQSLCGQLIKHVRVREFRQERKHFVRKLRSYLKSEKLQSLIADHYHQLSFVLPGNLQNLEAAGFDNVSIHCKRLVVTADQFFTSFKSFVKRIQNLTLSIDGSNRPTLPDSEVELMTDWMNNSDLGLKEFEINNYNITNLPVIPSLESLTIAGSDTFNLNGLNISAYSHLRCLKLSSLHIEDVSSLDGIHELHLLYCDKIRDISGLNHNYKIVIEECTGVTDYSNSFRYSKIIIICCPSNSLGEPIKSCDLSKALEAQKIYFNGNDCNKPLVLPQSSNLRFVQASSNLRRPFTLPSEHNIRELIVRDSQEFTSLLNFDRIYVVRLINLVYIYTLQGLGSGNRIVEVVNCPLISDFSILSYCDKVTIRDCAGFSNASQVRGVKDFIFSPAYVNQLPTVLEGVTCLILAGVPTYGFQWVRFPSTLKKLVINYYSANISLNLAGLPHSVEKIEVSVDEKSFRRLLEKGKVSFPGFIIEFKKTINFLRKIN